MKPRLFLCSGNALLEANRGFADRGVPFELRARSRAALPGGIGGDCIFHAVHIAITFDSAFKLNVTPVIDGVPLWDETAQISHDVAPERPFTLWYEVGLSVPVMHNGVELTRVGMIGTTFALDLWMPCEFVRTGEIFVEAAEIEFDVLNAGRGA